MCQVRRSNDSDTTSLGAFESFDSRKAKTLCSDQAVVHKNADPVNTFSATWKAPSGIIDYELAAFCTVVYQRTTYWIKIPSAPFSRQTVPSCSYPEAAANVTCLYGDECWNSATSTEIWTWAFSVSTFCSSMVCPALQQVPVTIRDNQQLLFSYTSDQNNQFLLSFDNLIIIKRVTSSDFTQCFSTSSGPQINLNSSFSDVTSALTQGNNYFISANRVSCTSGARIKVTLEVNQCTDTTQHLCSNRGPCVLNSTSSSYQCNCPDGYTGQYCEDTDECYRNQQCENGTCSDENCTFTCDCFPGYKGNLCELEIDECKSNPCR